MITVGSGRGGREGGRGERGERGGREGGEGGRNYRKSGKTGLMEERRGRKEIHAYTCTECAVIRWIDTVNRR